MGRIKVINIVERAARIDVVGAHFEAAAGDSPGAGDRAGTRGNVTAGVNPLGTSPSPGVEASGGVERGAGHGAAG